MNVLQVCSAEGIGGGEIHVADLALSLAERGLGVELAVRPASALPRYLSERGRSLPSHEVRLRNALDLGSARALARIVEMREIDIVHAHVARDYPVAAAACRFAPRARLVLTRHHYLPMKRNPITRRLLGNATIIAVSDSVRRTVVEALGCPSERVVTIPNWIDLDRYRSPRDRERERVRAGVERRYAVALFGQLTPLKGQEEFVRAAARVAARRDDVEFLVYGEDRAPGAPFLARLEALVKELGLVGTVRFPGYAADLPAVLAAVDVVAVPSWNEAFSLVTAEAMAAGRAIVASRAGALEELVTDRETGLLVPPRDPEALAYAILELLAAPELAAALGRAARMAAERFAREPRIEEIVTLYERALGA